MSQPPEKTFILDKDLILELDEELWEFLARVAERFSDPEQEAYSIYASLILAAKRIEYITESMRAKQQTDFVIDKELIQQTADQILYEQISEVERTQGHGDA